ncbi:transcriptional regulator [Noviherbaspirillum sedimenti]|uniref:Transcriptional regulator n=2 Tax=Noviherbaspirillum sedimenti TaxID=2320865 RepID=A0A3A3G9C3_9BURK|nr:MucB/RseB C-terminal domain-containing protein [Noviherbaspirillum sedimenti]RJG04275.1 transcriptional regulator [Noviherbaspirillum sedimenti]
MRQTPGLSKFFAFVLSSFIAFSVQAQAADSPVDKREAQAWLKNIQAAAVRLSYSGTFVYQQGEQFRTSRITHVKIGKNEYEKLEVLDGKPREYIRTNDEIICYVPDSKTLLVEKRVTPEVFPALPNANPARLGDHYRLSKGGTGRVAGYPTQAILLTPRDNLRYGYRLWAEQKSGLLLRAQTLNEKGEIVEQISFTQIEIGKIDRKRTRSSISNTQGWHIERAAMETATLSGWSVQAMPPGFRKIREVKRLVTNGAGSARPGHAAQSREMAQLVYSDGLAAISIFIEPAGASRAEGTMQQGAMNIAGKRHGDFWLTIVGEVPAVAVKQVANSIEFKTR